jgi:hypothetical protein
MAMKVNPKTDLSMGNSSYDSRNYKPVKVKIIECSNGEKFASLDDLQRSVLKMLRRANDKPSGTIVKNAESMVIEEMSEALYTLSKTKRPR